MDKSGDWAWEDNPNNPKYHNELIPPDRGITWGDFNLWLDLYYSHGEYGVIYSNKTTPYNLIKVVNCDITNGDSNYDQAEFIEENWRKDIEGLVKIYSFTRCKSKGIIVQSLQNKLLKTGDKYYEIVSVLDLDNGDELAMWDMEKADYVGLTHPDLTKDKMINRVAQAAYNIAIQTGYEIADLTEPNYGFRKDGSAFIFDFNLLSISHPLIEPLNLEDYKDKVKTNIKDGNTKV